eukprot:6194837-Pleurochrysis_carterae.AAC.1
MPLFPETFQSGSYTLSTEAEGQSQTSAPVGCCQLHMPASARETDPNGCYSRSVFLGAAA